MTLDPLAAEAGSGLGGSTAVLLALLSALVLAGLHLAAPHIRRLPFVPEGATASFASGLAVSYVFLHLLPELSEGNSELSEVLGDGAERGPLLGLGVFFVALVAFLLGGILAERVQGGDPRDAVLPLRLVRAGSRVLRDPARAGDGDRRGRAGGGWSEALAQLPLPR